MSSSKNLTLLILVSTLCMFVAGMYVGFITSRSHFNKITKVQLSLNTVLQSLAYARHFGRNEPDRAKLHILSDFELNLSRLIIVQGDASSNIKTYICENLAALVEDEVLIREFVKQINMPESYPSSYTISLNEVENCKSW